MLSEASGYQAINYFPDLPLGQETAGVLNDNLECLSFDNNSIDVFVALDVFEHLADISSATREIARVVKPDGLALLTFGILIDNGAAVLPRSVVSASGEIRHLFPPEYHGDPFSDGGALVYNHFGYAIHEWLHDVSGMNVAIIRFANPHAGIIGRHTEVMVLTH